MSHVYPRILIFMFLYNRFNTNLPPRSIAIRSLPEPTITSNLKNGYFLNIFFFSSAYMITEESKRISIIYINRYIIILSEKTTCLTNEIYVNVQDVLKNFNRYISEGKGHGQVFIFALTVISFSGSSVASTISLPVTIFLSLSISCFSVSSKSSDFASGAKIEWIY